MARKVNKRDGEMSEDQLVTHIDAKIENGIGSLGGEISIERQRLLDYYFGEKYGTERDGFSQVVTREVLETVEWMKPTLIEMFFGSHQAVEFEPTGSTPRDLAQAKQETAYCNHVFYKENSGFLEGYDWITDGLLQKVGIMKVQRVEEEKLEQESYENLNVMEMAQINAEIMQQNPEAEIEVAESIDNEDGTFDVVFHIKRVEKKTSVESIPPEEFINDNQHRNLKMQETKFCCHRRELHLSELVAMGYDEDMLMELGDDDSLFYNEEKINRNNKTDEQFGDDDDYDPKFVFEECYVVIDFDGDGIAELRQVNKINKTILDNELADNIPFAAICSVPVAHKYTGLCVADLVKDLQLIKSTLMRMFLDGLYQSNEPQLLVDEDLVEVSDLLNPTAGFVRGKRDGIDRIPTQAGEVVSNSLPAFETLEQMKEWRVGVTKVGQGLDSESISKSTFGAFDLAVAKSEQRIKMIARIFAETGFVDVFNLIRGIGIKTDDSKHIEYEGQWINVNPRSWRKQVNMKVNVGLGSNSPQEDIIALNNVHDKQKELLGTPYVTEGQFYNTLAQLAKKTGLSSPEMYFTNPETLPPPPPQPQPPDPLMASIRADLAVEFAKLKQKDRQEAAENLLKYIELELKYETDLEPAGIGEQRSEQRFGTDARNSQPVGTVDNEGAASAATSGQPATQ